MRKHGGPPSRRDKHVTLAAISPPGVARGRFVGGQKSGLAGCKPPPLFTRGASSCSSQGRRQGEPWGASPRPSAPTYLPPHEEKKSAIYSPYLKAHNPSRKPSKGRGAIFNTHTNYTKWIHYTILCRHSRTSRLHFSHILPEFTLCASFCCLSHVHTMSNIFTLHCRTTFFPTHADLSRRQYKLPQNELMNARVKLVSACVQCTQPTQFDKSCWFQLVQLVQRHFSKQHVPYGHFR